ncbi:MAG: hypothetical protein COU27_02865 [Candidatus Levybacteria bacterium CG10_big_fil_rev_8_21_14_0_10_36_7]|nr:MAG: hypothetical protein COU27_02865 [Candidatus Levybacteria bacterium CG10_big_fil_rev_8_21_14_0_10_36_7]
MNTKTNPLSKIKSFFSNMKLQGKSKLLIVAGGSLAVIVALFFFYEYFLHTLHIKVYLKANPIEKEINLDIPIKEATVSSSPLVKKTVEQEFSDKKQTTGVREIGEKATGKVTVHNFDDSERTFPAGTKLSKGSLTFLTDSEIKVPESTLVAGKDGERSKQSGKKEVAVTAEKIGEEFNIDSDTEFKIENLSDVLYFALATANFKGGTKKEVTTVSKKDIDTLEQTLTKQANDKAKDVLGAQIGPDEELVSDLTDVKIASTKFSQEVGEEASSLSVQAKSQIDYYVINKPELLSKLRDEIKKDLENGFDIEEKYITYEIKDVSEKKNDIIIDIKADGTASKSVDTKNILGVSTGKNIGNLESKLKSDFEIEKVEFEQPFGGRLPFLSFWSPLFTKNITISTSVR